jgi:phenylacetate-CoA ligase
MAAAVKLVPFSWIAGRAYRAVMARGEMFETASRADVLAYQEKELDELLAFVVEQVPAYRSMRRVVGHLGSLEALKEFPLIDKATLQENMADHLPRDLPRIPHYEITTGGTTGSQLRLFVEDNSQSVETAFVHRAWRRAGYTPRCRKAAFRGVAFPHLPAGVYWQPNPIYNELQFSPFHMSESTLGAYVDALLGYGPEYLHGYPSAIDMLAEYVLRKGLVGEFAGIRAVLLASEGCTTVQGERIGRAFGARVFPLYGHSERLIMGAPCETTDVYHHTPDYGILELVTEDGSVCTRPGERGELVGTSLLNRALPLVRYRTGDFATLADSECACGRHWDRFADVEGRWKQDMVVGRTGARISTTALNLHGDVFSRVKRYQYSQSEPGICVLRVVAAPGFSEADEDAILSAYRSKVGDELEIQLEVVDDIPLTERGKLKMLERSID